MTHTKHAHIHPISCGFGMAFLVELPHGLYLIDSGSPGQHQVVLRKIKALGRSDLKLIWITHAHYDHYGSAGVLREITGAPIGVHPADEDSLAMGISPIGTSRGIGLVFSPILRLLSRIKPLPPTIPNFSLGDDHSLDQYGLNARIVHTPGHTPGHTCLVLEDGIAFAADLISRKPRVRLQTLLATDWTQMPASLIRLQAARPNWIYTGHSAHAIPGELLQRINPEG